MKLEPDLDGSLNDVLPDVGHLDRNVRLIGLVSRWNRNSINQQQNPDVDGLKTDKSLG